LSNTLLEVRDLATSFVSKAGALRAVDGVSFTLERGRTLGIVGESGSGKSVSALSIMRLLPPYAQITRGEVILAGESLLDKSEHEMREVRGGRIAMIFQDPMTTLNPTIPIGEQIAEAVRIHRKLDARAARQRAIEMLEIVHMPAAAKRVDAFPHELSGGMRQRVMIAMALSCEPDVLIADEPTTALDVTIQAQILELMKEMQERLGMAILMITHDLGVVAEVCDDVLVMYAGRSVERGSVATIFANPQMPYTQGLLASLPRIDDDPNRPLQPIEGQPPNLRTLQAGCAFASRCPYVMPKCVEEPPLFEQADGHAVRCWLVSESAAT
jgi:oligopeptide/dipeptide ABC transporter ATP-binding protein